MALEEPVVWLEGLPGSGKTTLARLLAERLKVLGYPVEVLDGDEVREGLSPELGFTRKDREMHAHRVSYVAKKLSSHGIIPLVALITPYETSRTDARNVIGRPLVQVWLRCPVDVCQQRDPKGLYKRAQSGSLKQMTGVDDPFEAPLHPDLIVDTDTMTPEHCAENILAKIGMLGK